MSDPENCALDAHGNLKDAANIQWFNSPSDKNPIGSTSAPAESEPESEDDLPTIAAIKPGLKGKAPATHVGGKRVIKPSRKLREQSSKAVHSFFKKTFTVGRASTSKSSPDKAAADEGLNDEVPEPEAESSRKRQRPATSKGPAAKKHVKKTNQSQASDATGDTESTADDETEPEDANQSKYEQMKADAERDRQPKRKHNHRGQDERTQDIRTCFTKATREIDGKMRDGHICEICKHRGSSEADCFYTGRNSTLRMHIAWSWKTHGSIYLEKCDALGIKPNDHACPVEDDDDDEQGPQQAKLDGFVRSTPKWTKEGLLEHIVQFVVEDDQAFTLVDKKSFRGILKYQRPATKESDIPHHTKLQEEVIYKAQVIEKRLRDHFKDVVTTG
ncbi:hypothetical protein Hypma_013493 [Hypsizygus marmoreus]|uniref:Uncharacterized protein n=1 Tax=Hypsizygus marmoreus TaxID=39966 RepID=A0A369JBI7_HYPMA|nr:hypothetical protein Hypma_013493 [Hypsizygus marmoreus]